MLNNMAKRKIADPWVLEITTAPEPGTGSVAEATMDYATAVHEGRVKDNSLFFFHRQAGDQHDLTTGEGARAAVIEASGPAASWRDIDAIVALWTDPTTDRAYWERVWCNRLVKGSSQAFSSEQWKALARSDSPVQDVDQITLGFDGAMFFDSTGIVATHVETGYQWQAGIWERPRDVKGWGVPSHEVDETVRALFRRYSVWRMYADPPFWQSWLATWAGAFGEEHVIAWYTNRRKAMGSALEGFSSAIKQGLISHDGDTHLARHIANARRQELHERDDEGKPLWLIRKERPDSPHKIDLAMAAVLSWQARTDAVALGLLESQPSIYESRGVLVM